jgi:hypothetical protein
MQTMTIDRRTRRSEQLQEALSLQLAHVRDQASLDALVLATEEGLPVAHSGEDDLCVELAALAPFLPQEADSADPVAQRMRAVSISAGLPLYLVFYSSEAPPPVEAWLEHTHSGIRRILARD